MHEIFFASKEEHLLQGVGTERSFQLYTAAPSKCGTVQYLISLFCRSFLQCCLEILQKQELCMICFGTPQWRLNRYWCLNNTFIPVNTRKTAVRFFNISAVPRFCCIEGFVENNLCPDDLFVHDIQKSLIEFKKYFISLSSFSRMIQVFTSRFSLHSHARILLFRDHIQGKPNSQL